MYILISAYDTTAPQVGSGHFTGCEVFAALYKLIAIYKNLLKYDLLKALSVNHMEAFSRLKHCSQSFRHFILCNVSLAEFASFKVLQFFLLMYDSFIYAHIFSSIFIWNLMLFTHLRLH